MLVNLLGTIARFTVTVKMLQMNEIVITNWLAVCVKSCLLLLCHVVLSLSLASFVMNVVCWASF